MTGKRRGGGVGYHLSPGFFYFGMIQGSAKAKNCWFSVFQLANGSVGKTFRGSIGGEHKLRNFVIAY